MITETIPSYNDQDKKVSLFKNKDFVQLQNKTKTIKKKKTCHRFSETTVNSGVKGEN